MKTTIKTTNRINGMLEQGGVCGKVVKYPAALVSEIMECDISTASKMDGSEKVPYCQVQLADYLDYHHSNLGKIIRKGIKIQ